jgi:DNA-directed RNA polymerase subunit RPC12/RpoP
MSEKKQEIDLKFKCHECGKEVHIADAEELFSSSGTQLSAESERLYCDECND